MMMVKLTPSSSLEKRSVNVVASVANGYTPEERLEGMHFQIGDWHAGVKILSVSFVVVYQYFFSDTTNFIIKCLLTLSLW